MCIRDSIAEMIIKGSNNGVLEMEKVLAHNEELADTASRALAKAVSYTHLDVYKRQPNTYPPC